MTTQRPDYPNQQAELDVIQSDRRRAYWRANVRLIRIL